MIEILMIILNALCMAFGIYFAITCTAGLFRRRKKEEGHAWPERRIAAVIAARNEEAVIGELVASLVKQKYPRELFDVYVVPNNCTDRTEERAREAGARILRCSGRVASKGDALRCAFSQLMKMENGYDAYCIFDADNLVDPMFFQAVNDARARGVRVAQGFRDSKNPYAGWVAGCMSAFYWFMSRFYNAGRSALGMSAALNGTGFMVADDVIREIGWETVTLTEDLEFSALCALKGIGIGWMPEARVYDEQPETLRDSVVQRRRWSAGSLQCFKRYAGRLYAKRTLHALDMGVLFTGMMMNLVGAASFVFAVWRILEALIASPGLLPGMLILAAGALAACWLVLAVCCALIFRMEGKLNRRSAPAAAMFPIFLLTWMIINISCFFTRPPRWDAIRHTGGRDVPA